MAAEVKPIPETVIGERLTVSPPTFRKCRNQILATIIVTIGSFGTGTVFGWSAVATDDLKKSGDFGSLSQENEISWVTSLAILGAFLAGPLAGFLMDRCGRRRSIIIFSLPFALGWVVMCSAWLSKPQGFYLLYIGRILTGICAGGYLVLIPTYIKEVSIDSMRGVLGSAMPLMLVSGILYTFTLGTFCNWALLSALCGVVPFLLAIGLCIIPETPRYLIVKNRRDEAVRSFKWLNSIESYEIAEAELDYICSTQSITSCNRNRSPKSNWKQLMTPPVAKPIYIILSVVFFQQFGGVNAVTLYTVEIFRGAGDFIQPHVATIIMAIVQVVFVILSMILVDVLGRKTLLIICNLIMGVSLFGLGFYFYMKEKGDGSEINLSWMPITTILTYIAAYSTGVGPIPWVLGSEIYNPEFRAESSTIMTSAYWIFGFIVSKTYENIKIGFRESGSFWFYGAFCLGGALFSLMFVPETKGKSSEEIIKHFGGETSSRHSGDGDANHNGGISDTGKFSPSLLYSNPDADTSINETYISNNGEIHKTALEI
ncbi:unnamed protein product [Orchesella dallaii]|uniref:Major facilitator superfamily (MFS) profile domain-containing protein n=1 Tax=Orchesella dallaii TaxID=48710 RepID=A0ABP1QJ10_9HEXA